MVEAQQLKCCTGLTADIAVHELGWTQQPRCAAQEQHWAWKKQLQGSGATGVMVLEGGYGIPFPELLTVDDARQPFQAW